MATRTAGFTVEVAAALVLAVSPEVRHAGIVMRERLFAMRLELMLLTTKAGRSSVAATAAVVVRVNILVQNVEGSV